MCITQHKQKIEPKIDFFSFYDMQRISNAFLNIRRTKKILKDTFYTLVLSKHCCRVIIQILFFLLVALRFFTQT
jgi:hypothetical protein